MTQDDTRATIDRRTAIEDLPQYLTVEEIESYLAIGRSAAYAFARAHGIRIGRLVRVPREVLRRLDKRKGR